MADVQEKTSASIRFNGKRRPRPEATTDRDQLKLRSKAPSHSPLRFQRQRIARTSNPASVGRRGAHAYRSALKPFVTKVFSRMIYRQKVDYATANVQISDLMTRVLEENTLTPICRHILACE